LISFEALESGAVPLTVHGGRPPGPAYPGRAFGRIDDTLSVVDKGTALTLRRRGTSPCLIGNRADGFAP
jgi:hypothetical protein